MFKSEQERVERLGSAQERQFYLEFLFEMTIAGRLFWEHPFELKQLNEMNHRVLNRIRDLDKLEQWSSSSYVPDYLAHYATLAPKLEGEIQSALDRAFKKLAG